MRTVLVAAAAAGSLLFQSTPPRPTIPGYHRQPRPEAYFVLQATQTLRPSPEWPDEFWKYSLFICSGSTDTLGVRRAKNSGEPSIALAYTNTADVRVAGSGSGAYYDSLEARFDTTFCIRDLDDGGRCVRMHLPSSTEPTWIPFPASVDALVGFHEAITLTRPWDGMYLDECTLTYPAWRIALLPTNFDINGDDVPDTVQELQDQWTAGTLYWIAQMRAAVGGAYLIANTAGSRHDANLNGVTIEGIGHTVDEADALASFRYQKSIGRTPFIGVGWITDASADIFPTERVVASVPGVYYGVIGN